MVDSKTLAHTVLELATKPNAQQHIDTFIEFLKANNLTGLLPQIRDNVQRIADSQAQEKVLHVYSKHALSDAEIAEIQTLAGAQDALVELHIDESVIGGFSATYNGFIYNGGLDHQVTRLKNMLTFS